MRLLAILVFCVMLASTGCTRNTGSGFRAGDCCVAELQYAPAEPWTVGTKVALGMLVKLERTTGETVYVQDTEIMSEQATMKATITFFDGRKNLGEPQEVPFVRDC